MCVYKLSADFCLCRFCNIFVLFERRSTKSEQWRSRRSAKSLFVYVVVDAKNF